MSAKDRTKPGLGWAGWEAEEVRGWKFLSGTVNHEEDGAYQAGLADSTVQERVHPRRLCFLENSRMMKSILRSSVKCCCLAFKPPMSSL